MKQKFILALAAAAFAAGLSLSTAEAFTPGNTATAAPESLMQKTHFRHRSCELGVYGWHRHVGPHGWRVACWPRARHPHRCWIGRHGHRHCWW